MIVRLITRVLGRVVAVRGRLVIIYGNFTGTINMGDQIDQARTQLERERLLEKVRRLVEEPLRGQLPGEPIPVSLQYCPDAILGQAIGGESPTGPVPSGTTIGQVFTEQDRKLLVLGEGGAGKARALRELALDLIEEAERDERVPIPLVVNLASWGRKHSRIADWLVDELSQAGAYDQHPDRAFALVSQEKFLPLLVGLHLVPSNRRADCVGAINRFRQGRRWVRGMAVGCQTDDYYALSPTRLNLQCAVLLCPLNEKQIDDYLIGRGLNDLRDAIKREPMLVEMAKSPLTLSFMASVFRDQHELPPGTSPDRRKARLVEAYVDNRFSSGDLSSPYSPERVTHSLQWLATSLRERGESAFYVDRLQPNWLPNGRALVWYTLIDRAGTGAIVACLLGALFALHFASSELAWIGALVGALVGAFLGGQGGTILGPKRSLAGIARGALAAFVGVGVSAGLLVALARPEIKTVALAVVVGAFVGALAGGLAGGPDVRARSVVLPGPLGWSPVLAIRHAAGGFTIGSIFGALFGLITLLAGIFVLPGRADGGPVSSALLAMLYAAVLFGLVLAFGFGLLGGLTAGIVDEGSFPNQAVQRAQRRAALVLGGGTIISGLLFGALFLFIGPSTRLGDNVDDAARAALLIGPIVGLVAALAFGGYAYLSHFALRLVLSRYGLLPLRCIRFLEHAKQLDLLVRVGSGYEFRPGILEHFIGDNHS